MPTISAGYKIRLMCGGRIVCKPTVGRLGYCLRLCKCISNIRKMIDTWGG